MIPKVSILVPAHNCAKTIERSLLSLAEQTFKDFEVILVLNNCTDETGLLARKFSDNLKIKILNNVFWDQDSPKINHFKILIFVSRLEWMLVFRHLRRLAVLLQALLHRHRLQVAISVCSKTSRLPLQALPLMGSS